MTSNMAVLLIAAALFSSGPLAHAAPASLRDVLGKQDDRRPAPPPVAHYVSGDGQAFVLDRSGAVPLLKFEQSVEIWALSPSAAPRGDVIYRNDVGQPVLRATKLGGLTVFTAQRPSGAPAALMGEADFLRIPAPVSAATLLQRLAQASVRASRAAQHLIPFEASGVTPGSEPIYADAAALAAEGITRIARMPDGRVVAPRLGKVRLIAGRKPSVVVNAGVMQVVLTPSMGMAGRPSSERIIYAARRAR